MNHRDSTAKTCPDNFFQRRDLLKLTAGLAAMRRIGLGAGVGISPRAFTSENGVLNAVLEPGFIEGKIGGQTYLLVAYNGSIPGPTLEARPGDTVRITLNNKLDHPTNLHFHGLHVPPDGRADNVFLEAGAGDSAQYEFKIPENHPAGLFWYHPHAHSFSNLQIRSGLAGLIRIRGGIDDIGDIPSAVTRDVVLQDLQYFVWDPPHAPGHLHVHHPAPEEPHPNWLMVNGRVPELDETGFVAETVKVGQGGLLRLRILNASANRICRLAVVSPDAAVGHRVWLIATDGNPLPAPQTVSELLLVPGQRVEILMQTNRGQGKFSLMELPYYTASFLQPKAALPLLTFEYEGSVPRPLQVPPRLGEVGELLPPSLPVRRMEFSLLATPDGVIFRINGTEFDPNRVDLQAKLGSVEDWDLVNNTFMDHTFHLHTNNFQLVDSAGKSELALRDSIILPRFQSARVRIRFADFTGKTLFHCHEVFHEDRGMMQVIEVVP